MAKDTWTDRDLPVLNAIVELADDGADYVLPETLAERLDMSEDDVQRALQALADEEERFFKFTDGSSLEGSCILAVSNPTGHARRTVGSWPTPEALADRLTQALAVAADKEPDEEKRGKLRTAASWFGNAGRDVLVDVASSVITKSAGLG